MRRNPHRELLHILINEKEQEVKTIDAFSLIVPISSGTVNTKLKQDEFDRFHSFPLLPVRRKNGTRHPFPSFTLLLPRKRKEWSWTLYSLTFTGEWIHERRKEPSPVRAYEINPSFLEGSKLADLLFLFIYGKGIPESELSDERKDYRFLILNSVVTFFDIPWATEPPPSCLNYSWSRNLYSV